MKKHLPAILLFIGLVGLGETATHNRPFEAMVIGGLLNALGYAEALFKDRKPWNINLNLKATKDEA